MAQYLRPSSDYSIYPNDGSWVNEVGGTTNLYDSIDEVVPSDTTYITRPNVPSPSAYVIFKLSYCDTPVGSGNHIIRLRMGSPTQPTFTVSLLNQGGTNEIAFFVVYGAYHPYTFSYYLTGFEVAHIFTYNDLYIKVSPVADLHDVPKVYWLEFEVPDGQSSSSSSSSSYVTNWSSSSTSSSTSSSSSYVLNWSSSSSSSSVSSSSYSSSSISSSSSSTEINSSSSSSESSSSVSSESSSSVSSESSSSSIDSSSSSSSESSSSSSGFESSESSSSFSSSSSSSESSSSFSSSSSSSPGIRDIRSCFINQGHYNILPFTFTVEKGYTGDIGRSSELGFVVEGSASQVFSYSSIIKE